MIDYYALLSLPNTVSSDTLKQQFSALLKKHLNQNNEDINDSNQNNLNAASLEAFFLLLNDDTRRKYDLLLKHKNNTEVRHSLKYRQYTAIVEVHQHKSRLEAQKVCAMDNDALKKYVKESETSIFSEILWGLGSFGESISNFFSLFG